MDHFFKWKDLLEEFKIMKLNFHNKLKLNYHSEIKRNHHFLVVTISIVQQGVVHYMKTIDREDPTLIFHP